MKDNETICPKCGHAFDPEVEFLRLQLIETMGEEWVKNFDRIFKERTDGEKK